MVSKQLTFNLLLSLILICFSFFGSLSHAFTAALILLVLCNHIQSWEKQIVGFNAKLLFLALTGCFFLFLIGGFRDNFEHLLYSLSPMLPLPLIGSLILFHSNNDFKLTAKNVSSFSQASILIVLIIYLLLTIFSDVGDIYYKFHANRLMLLSGNPIPFSFVILGISIFCLADWRSSESKNKIIGVLFFLIGAYIAAFLSGTRGTLLALLLVAPIIIYYLTNSYKFSILIISIVTLIGLLFISFVVSTKLEHEYIYRITNGLKTIFLFNDSDTSVGQRLEMWSAAAKASSKELKIGYGVTERFNALKPYLNNSNFNYTHPHNDIFAGLISSGILGGIATLISLASGLIAAFLAPKRSVTKLYFGFMLSCTALTTGNISTVLFNDISSAWLAFSTYLIWATDFKSKNSKQRD